MNEQDQRLDDIFKRKVTPIEVPFREEDWLNAKRMIDADRKKRKRHFFLLFILLVTLTGLAASYYFFPLQASGRLSLDDERILLAASERISVDHEDHAAVQRHDADNAASTGNTTNTISASQPRSVHSSSQDGPVSRKTTMQQRDKAQQPQQKPSRRNSKKLTSGEQLYIVTSADANVETNPVPATYHIRSKAYHPFFRVASLCDTCRKTVDDYLAYKQENNGRNTISVIAGVNYYNNARGWGFPLNTHFGLMYSRRVLPAFSFSTGILYTRIHQDLPVRSFSATGYTFGPFPESVSIETKRIDYLEIPLSIGLHLSTKHAVSGGASYLRLLQSSDLVTTSIAQPNSMTREQRTNGYTSVLNPADWQLHLTYTYAISTRLAISAGYYRGLSDITRNDAYRSEGNDRNSGIRLTAGYRLW
jgi:hypothetical protein